jgi:HAE1 family hydrophobic/amphiphilic exporter-1
MLLMLAIFWLHSYDSEIKPSNQLPMATRQNWVTRFTHFFLRQRQLSLMLFVLLMLGGVFALTQTRREGFPQVPVKIVVVTTPYRGASPAEIERSVSIPLENAIKDIKSISEISSSSRPSVSVLRLTLDEKANLDAVTQDITSKVGRVELPKDADKPQVFQPNTGNSAFTFALASGKLSTYDLYRQGGLFQREISQVKGIKSVTLVSSATPKIRITFNPTAAASRGVDLTTVGQAIATSNLSLPVGTVTIDGQKTSVLVDGTVASLSDLSALLIPGKTGNVKLSDIAKIELYVDEASTINRVGHRSNNLFVSEPALVYAVDTRGDADILRTDTALTTALDRITHDGTLSSDVSLVRVGDEAEATRAQIKEITTGAFGNFWDGIGPLGIVGVALGGIWLLMLAMLLFVNVRTALIAGVAIPLSFFFTLICLWLGGITLNTLTLFSMILVLGLVVDPAIVVLEAMQHYRDQGYRGREAVLAAVSSIGPGVYMAVITSMVVFVPFGIVSGVFGQIIRFIPITVIPALTASFFVPLIFLTALGDKYLKGRKDGAVDEEASLWAVSRWFKRANAAILRRTWLQILIIVLAAVLPLVVTGYFVGTGKIKSVQFSKPTDTEQMLVTINYPAGSDFARTQDLSRQTEAALLKQPEIRDYYYFQQGSGSFSILINLRAFADRVKTSTDVAATLNDQLPHDNRTVFAKASTLSYGPPEAAFPVVLQIYEGDLDKLKKFTLAVADHAARQTGVTRVSDGYRDAGTEVITIRPTVGGISALVLGGQLTSNLSEQKVTALQFNGEQVDVYATVGINKPTSLTELGNLPIGSAAGISTVSKLSTLSVSDAPGAIQRLDGNRYSTVSVALKDDVNQYKFQADLNDWAKSQLGNYGLRSDALESKGVGNDIAKSFGELFTALGLSLVLTYFILVLFFRSWLQPLIIVFAVPLSFIGVFPILWLIKSQFGFLEILGIITLVGIVENVGIFVIDYANRRREEGMPTKEAIALATAVRFRPIFLTKITALGSLLPLAIISPFWRGLSSVIIAGILTSGILSLFTTPILYHWFDKLSRLPLTIRNRFRRQQKLV